MVKYINLQIQEAQLMLLKKKNTKKSIPRNVLIKFLEITDKKKNLKAAREKWMMYYLYRTMVWMTINFLSETMGTGMIFSKCWEGKPVKPEFNIQKNINEGNVSMFLGKGGLREFTGSVSAVKVMLKEVLQMKENDR